MYLLGEISVRLRRDLLEKVSEEDRSRSPSTELRTKSTVEVSIPRKRPIHSLDLYLCHRDRRRGKLTLRCRYPSLSLFHYFVHPQKDANKVH